MSKKNDTTLNDYLKKKCVVCRGYQPRRDFGKNSPPVQGSAVQVLQTGFEVKGKDACTSNLSKIENSCSVKVKKVANQNELHPIC